MIYNCQPGAKYYRNFNQEGKMVKIAKKMLIWLLALGLMSGGFMGCSETDDDDDALPLPPDASMSIDLTAFNGDKMAPSVLAPGENFNNAIARVAIVNLAVVIALSPGTTVFKAASSATPVEESDGSWTWKYTAKWLFHTFEANLNGRMEGFGTVWSMKVSCDSLDVPVDNFEWYTGEVQLDNSSGSWRFFDYKTPDMAREIGTIEWEVKDRDTSELMFSNTNSESEDNGDTLTYSLDGTTAEISYYDDSEDLTAEIIWDTITIAGSIMVPGYNNGERAYWDEDLQNTDEP
jgi:hypothetical protein